MLERALSCGTALALTLAVESAALCLFIAREKPVFTYVFILINVATNLFLNAVALPLLYNITSSQAVIWTAFSLLEVAITLCEWLTLRTVCKNKYLLLFVIAANVASVAVGFAVL